MSPRTGMRQAHGWWSWGETSRAARRCGRGGRARGGGRRLLVVRDTQARQGGARLADGRVPPAPEAPQAPGETAAGGALADLRLRRPPRPSLAVPASSAVQAALDDAGAVVPRVPAIGRLRPRVRQPAQGSVLRARPEDRQDRVA